MGSNNYMRCCDAVSRSTGNSVQLKLFLLILFLWDWCCKCCSVTDA